MNDEQILKAARWLVHERHFSVIPLDSPIESHETDPHRIGKVPIIRWAAFQRALPSDDNLASWFSRGPRNLGLVTGAASQIVAIDGDSPEALAWMRAHLPPTEMRTPRGEHWFFKHPGPPIPNKTRLRVEGTALALDVRADGGYVVAPPSIHASGVEYARLGTWPPVSQLPIFNPAWLAFDGPPPGSPATNGAAAGPEDRAHLLRRARAYVAQVPPAIEGQGGDTATYQLACRLVLGFRLDDAEAFDLLSEWNHRCAPPWTAAALDAKIRSARKYGREPIGARAATPPPRRPPREPSAAPEPANGPSPIDTFAYTDLGNAEAFSAWHGDEWRFDHQQGVWRHWEAPIWAPDDDGLVVRMMAVAMRRRYHAAADLPDSATRAQAAKWAIASESRHRLDAALHLAGRLTPIANAGDQWDTDPYLLACPNGVVDLRTGDLHGGDPSDNLTLRTASLFDPAAPCPRFERFMLEITNYDSGLVEYLQRALGSSITGDTADQVWHLLIGPGSGGKSTLLRIVGSVLGSYAYVAPFSTFIRDPRGGTMTNDLAALRGRRFVAASEVREHARLDEGRVKSLTGGDPVTARYLFREYFSFVPVLHLWLAANHEPIVGDDSRGFWRRVRLVPLTQQFPICRTLAEELGAEAPGILAWLVRGALDWQANGLTPPPSVCAATTEYEETSDLLAPFLAAACLIDSAESIRGSEFYRLYTQWADGAGLSAREQLTSTAFGRLVSARFTKSRTVDGIVYSGVSARLKGSPQCL